MGLIFGRVVAGFLEEQAGTFRQFDAITASPTHVGPNGRSFNHTRMVLERAAAEVPPGAVWPFDIAGEPLIVKTGPTPRMVGNGYRTAGISPKALCVTPCGSPGPRTSAGSACSSTMTYSPTA